MEAKASSRLYTIKVVAQAEMMCAYRPVAPKTSDAGKQA